VRHLLTHTSGWATTRRKVDLHRDYAPEELLKFAAAQPLEFSPGQKWSYSNTGYMVLGILIQRASGQFYGDMLRDRVFKPLGMDTARVISEADIVPNRAAGYRLVDGGLKNQDWVAPSLNTTADGALYFSVLDMARWDAALYTERLLKRASLEQIFHARAPGGRIGLSGQGGHRIRLRLVHRRAGGPPPDRARRGRGRASKATLPATWTTASP
jgi:CubicO group peptidase (beta-lactamase class C family)